MTTAVLRAAVPPPGSQIPGRHGDRVSPRACSRSARVRSYSGMASSSRPAAR